MSEDKNNINIDAPWWRPVAVFYVKTISWTMIPLVFAVILGNYVRETTRSQSLFFVLIMVGFAVTCYGIYSEIKEYKKGLDKEDKLKKNDDRTRK